MAGDSGGAPDAVREGRTGHVVEGRSVAATADRLIRLLRDPAEARAMGARGRARVRAEWTWDHANGTLRGLLGLGAPAGPGAGRPG